jgi:predicted transcriptional regulator
MLVVAIDDFSRYAYVRPLKNEKHESIIEALKSIFEEGRIPSELRTDKGSEWINRWTKQYLKREDVHHFVTQNVTHANYAERFITDVSLLHA